ncbi:MAG TPA: hypothetical protein VFE47_02565 [Tepidisphaeraceae bacterium]|nr:hypothetical protein [Tepidisphaeraceae bacterium]
MRRWHLLREPYESSSGDYGWIRLDWIPKHHKTEKGDEMNERKYNIATNACIITAVACSMVFGCAQSSRLIKGLSLGTAIAAGLASVSAYFCFHLADGDKAEACEDDVPPHIPLPTDTSSKVIAVSSTSMPAVPIRREWPSQTRAENLSNEYLASVLRTVFLHKSTQIDIRVRRRDIFAADVIKIVQRLAEDDAISYEFVYGNDGSLTIRPARTKAVAEEDVPSTRRGSKPSGLRLAI